MSASVPFVTGNPKIEMLTGSVQILRTLVPAPRPEVCDSSDILGETEVACLVDAVAPSKESHVMTSSSSPQSAPSRVVAVLCVPARFVPTDLLSILAPFHDNTQAVRLLRHCDDPRQFMALVALNSKQHAGEVVAALDGTPYNSFESAPILIAFVRAVVFDFHRNSSHVGGIADNKALTTRRIALDEEVIRLPASTDGDIACKPIEEWKIIAFVANEGYITAADLRCLRISGRGAALLPANCLDSAVDQATRSDLLPSLSQQEVVDFEDDNDELWAAAFPTRVHRVVTDPSEHLAGISSAECIASSPDNKQSSTSSNDAGNRTKSQSPQNRSGDGVRGYLQQEQSAQCVVCLEPLESDGSQALLTTACNHSFHVRCLAQWSDAPCPVCRYHHNLASISSQCQWVGDSTDEHSGVAGSNSNGSSSSSESGIAGTGERSGYGHRYRNSETGAVACCGASSGLLVCVICGFVGCARRRHARRHYEESLHAYALAMDTQQVWDFAGDGYVHRLVVSKGLAPVSHSSSSSSGFDHGGNSSSSGGRSSSSGSTSEEWSGTPKLVETTSPGSIVAASDARHALSAACRNRFTQSADAASTLAEEYGRPPVLGYRLSYDSPDRGSNRRGGAADDDATRSGSAASDNSSSSSSSSPLWSPFHWQGNALDTASSDLGPDSSADALELDVHRKLEGLSFQYHELLAGQLEAQRAYFAQELDAVRRQRMRGLTSYHPEGSSSSRSSGGGSGGGGGGGSSGSSSSSREDGLENGWPIPDGASLPQLLPPDALLAALAREKRALEQRLVAAKKRQSRAREERAEVEACNVQLADNVSVWQRKVEVAKAAAVAVEAQREKLLPPLQAKVADLMLKLDQTTTSSSASPSDPDAGAAAGDSTAAAAADGSEDATSPLSGAAAEEEEGDTHEWAVGPNVTGSASKKKRPKKKVK